MKTILIFGPDEEADARIALDGRKWYLFVEDYNRALRDRFHYGNDPHGKGSWAEAHELLHSMMQEAGLDLEGYA